MKSSPLLCALAATALVSAAACGRGKTVSSPDGKVTYTEQGKDAATMTFTGKNGEKVTTDLNSGKLPADYPADVPVYKDARVTLAQTMTEKNGRNIILESKDAADKIGAFYKSALESNGWKIEGTVAMGELNMITAVKGGKQFVVQINNAHDQRMITQTVMDKQ
jgi:hypothetical protein